MAGLFDHNLLDTKRKETDPLADAVIEEFFPMKKNELQAILAQFTDNLSVKDFRAKGSLEKLIDEMEAKTSMIDKSIQADGVQFFGQHASDVMLLLGFLSLPYCYAAANGAEVLVRSKRIMNEPDKRLTETAQFVFDVMSKDAFGPNGKALAVILKVRLMHAATRWYVLQSNDWNAADFGMPINQEDMAGTNLSFSLMIVRGLRRLGKVVQAAEAFAYITYWNQIGALLGLSDDLQPQDNKGAFLLEKRIRERQFKYSIAGQKLAASLFSYFREVSKDSPLDGKVMPFAQFLLGDKVSEMIGITVNETDQQLFKPYTVFLQLSNQVINRGDSYAKAFLNYKKQVEGVAYDPSFNLK